MYKLHINTHALMVFVGHNKPWVCTDTNYGPEINGTNPRLVQEVEETTPANQTTVIALSVLVPIISIFIIVGIVLVSYKHIY